jgi:Uma2 family endonuclease
MVVQAKTTAAAYLELPESAQPMMLLDGEVIALPSPVLAHQLVVGRLFALLLRLGPNGQLVFAPFDVQLDDWNVVQPDLLWVAERSRLCVLLDRYARGAPDFVAEVLSPGTTRYDRKVKFELYERYGTREYWLVDPAEQYVEAYAREGDRLQRLGVYAPDETLPSRLFGAVALRELFDAVEMKPASDSLSE